MMRILTANFKSGIYLLSSNIIVSLAHFITSILFTRIFTPEVYGQYTYIFSIIGTLSFFSLPGLNIAIMQASSRKYKNILEKISLERLKYSFIVTFIFILLGIYMLATDKPTLFFLLIVSGFLAPFYYSFDGYASYLIGKRRFVEVSQYRVISSLVNAILILVFVLFITRNLAIIIAVNLLSVGLINFYYTNLLARKEKKEINSNKEMKEICDVIKYGQKLSFINCVSTIEYYLDRLIIGSFLKFDTLAFYSIGKMVSDYTIKNVWQVVYQIIFPDLGEVEFNEAKSRLLKKMIIIEVLFFGLCVGLALIIPYLIKFVFSKRYIESAKYAQIFIIFGILNIPGVMIETLFQAQKREKAIYTLRIVTVLTHILLLLILVWRWKIWGIVFASVISYCIFYPIVSIYLLKNEKD
ncbi:MAG: oligosaccharide flippase family protein [Elusimicrobiota bacterium]|nr:oligosaccharide flippase family protein [Endomicrobiia bacterium]MDW8166029.1 oligosaccharide flippase family protein [Elusimicrobiota bacterium]